MRWSCARISTLLYVPIAGQQWVTENLCRAEIQRTQAPGSGIVKKKKNEKKSGDQSSPPTSRSGHPVCAGLCQDIYIAIAELDSNGFRLRHQIPCRAKIYRTQAPRKKQSRGPMSTSLLGSSVQHLIAIVGSQLVCPKPSHSRTRLYDRMPIYSSVQLEYKFKLWGSALGPIHRPTGSQTRQKSNWDIHSGDPYHLNSAARVHVVTFCENPGFLPVTSHYPLLDPSWFGSGLIW